MTNNGSFALGTFRIRTHPRMAGSGKAERDNPCFFHKRATQALQRSCLSRLLTWRACQPAKRLACEVSPSRLPWPRLAWPTTPRLVCILPDFFSLREYLSVPSIAKKHRANNASRKQNPGQGGRQSSVRLSHCWLQAFCPWLDVCRREKKENEEVNGSNGILCLSIPNGRIRKGRNIEEGRQTNHTTPKRRRMR